MSKFRMPAVEQLKIDVAHIIPYNAKDGALDYSCNRQCCHGATGFSVVKIKP